MSSTNEAILTTLQAAQANTLAAVQVQVDNMNAALKANYMTAFNNWAQSVLAGRIDNTNPPQPPMGYVVGYFNDPTTGPGSIGPYGDTVIQWAYPMASTTPVCQQPPLPQTPKPQPAMPPRTDILNVPLGDVFPVGHILIDPNTGHQYQKQSSPTPFGIAYWYQEVS